MSYKECRTCGDDIKPDTTYTDLWVDSTGETICEYISDKAVPHLPIH